MGFAYGCSASAPPAGFSCRGRHMTPLLLPVFAFLVSCSAIRGLLSNPHLQLVPYIHHLLPGQRQLPVLPASACAWRPVPAAVRCGAVFPVCGHRIPCSAARGLADAALTPNTRCPVLPAPAHPTPALLLCPTPPTHLQAAALLGQVAVSSQQHQDELAGALGRIQKTLAASLFDEAPQTQYGAPPAALLAPAGLAQLPTHCLLCCQCRCRRPVPVPALFSHAQFSAFLRILVQAPLWGCQLLACRCCCKPWCPAWAATPRCFR